MGEIAITFKITDITPERKDTNPETWDKIKCALWKWDVRM
jgi:hypothetical protein